MKDFTQEELKAIEYHLEYDIDTIGENHNWDEIRGKGAKEVSLSALAKIKSLIKK